MNYMKYKISILLLISVIGVSLWTGCVKKPSPDDKVLAEVSSKFITVNDLKKRISKLPPYYQDIINKNKKKFLDETIVEILFYEEAIRKGLDRDKEFKEIMYEAKKKILIAKLIKTEVEDKITVSDEEARKFYEANKENFKSPELWRASHILVATEGEAKEIQNELAKGASFEELARTRSMDATASRGGDVGYFRMGQVVPEFEKAALKLKPGEVSGIVQTQFGYHIIKLTDKKEPGVETYDKVKQAIEDELKKRRRSELFDELVEKLKNKYRVSIKENVFNALEDLEGGKRVDEK
ncbi:MAG: peptidyl-prolyl cis-trans isomerase [Candidatus Omnitrophica bacterium]|nr:peptidyl-prolyl cis-trans isomerase [Candidatus Omnitrophota bacterium]